MLGDHVDCYNVARVELKAGAIVSQYAYLCTAGHDITDPGFKLITAPITVGVRAWICTAAYLQMGVTIGDGAVVAARSVVLRDVEPWSVVGGHPAHFIKRRELRQPSQ